MGFHSAGFFFFSFKTPYSQNFKLDDHISQFTQQSSSSNCPGTIIKSGHFHSQKYPDLVDKL